MCLSQKRLFFAIGAARADQRQIVRWRAGALPAKRAARCCSKPPPALAFSQATSAARNSALAAMAGRISQPGFTLTLDDAGRWLRSRVVWLGTRQPPRGLLQLANMRAPGRRLAAVTRAAAVSSLTLRCTARAGQAVAIRHRAFTGPFQ